MLTTPEFAIRSARFRNFKSRSYEENGLFIKQITKAWMRSVLKKSRSREKHSPIGSYFPLHFFRALAASYVPYFIELHIYFSIFQISTSQFTWMHLKKYSILSVTHSQSSNMKLKYQLNIPLVKFIKTTTWTQVVYFPSSPTWVYWWRNFGIFSSKTLVSI